MGILDKQPAQSVHGREEHVWQKKTAAFFHPFIYLLMYIGPALWFQYYFVIVFEIKGILY